LAELPAYPMGKLDRRIASQLIQTAQQIGSG
jgi:hypothetical protein